MTKIKNTGAYPIKKYPIATDFFIGSDSENNGETVNFEIQNIINMASGLMDYIYSKSSLPITSPQGDGYFQTNGITDFASITNISVSKKTLAGQDLTPFLNWLSSNITEFTLYIVSKTNQNIFVNFSITSVTEHPDYFLLTVELAPGNNYLGQLIDKDIYTFKYEKTASGSVLDILTQTITDGDTLHAPSGNAVFDALALLAPLASPAFTGIPTAPTPAPGTNTAQLATAAFVTGAINLLDSNLLHKTGNETKTGNLTVNSIIRAGGLATQFLKADGSIDSNTYLTAESDTLQTVTNRGAVTTTSLTALSFIKTGGLASQFLKANGSIDATVYAVDSTVIHTTGNEVKTGSLTVNSIIRAGGLATQFLKADGSIDSNTYLTAESDTLQTVTNRGAVTTTSLTALSFIKSGGTASQYLMADGSVTTAANIIIPATQVTATPHVDYLTGANVQLQLDNTETNVVGLYKIDKTDDKTLKQTGRYRPDTDVSVLSISPANTLNITACDNILFVNEIMPDVPANKVPDFLKSFGNKSFVANGTNTPLAADTRGIFYVGLDKLGNQVYRTSKVYDQDVAYMARLLVNNTAGVYTIVSAKYFPDLANNRVNNRDRLVLSSGYIVPSGAASISFGNRGMTYSKNSINYSNNKLDPNYLTIADSVNPTPMSFLFFLPNITSLAVSIASSTVINPTVWYTAGGAVGGGAVNPIHYQVYKLFITVTGTIAIQTKASTTNAPDPGVNAIFATREAALAGLTSTTFPDVLPAGDSIALGTFYLRAGTAVNGSTMTDPNDFYFRPFTATSSSSSVGVTVHDLLSGKNDNPAFQHVTTTDIANWNIAFADRMKWDGGATGLVAATGRTSLGGTTVGQNVFTSPNPTAIRFLRANADNSVSWLDAATFRNDIGAGVGNGSVTSVNMTVPTGLTIAGNPITTSGTLALSLMAGYSIPTTIKQGEWDLAYVNRITSLTTTGSSGAATLSANVLNVPNYTLTGLGGINFSSVLSGFVTGANTTVLNTDTLDVALEKLQGQINARTSGVAGTGNTVAKFTGAGTIGNSNITDTGSLITLGGVGVATAGNIGIKTASYSNSITIYMPANITGGVDAYGIYQLPVIQSDVTTSAVLNRTFAGTQAASFTLARLSHFEASQGTFGAGSTVTNQTGFYAYPSLIGATNNYGFRGDIPAGTGNWNLYMGGTAQNYFAGNLGVGIITPTKKLEVIGDGRFTKEVVVDYTATSGIFAGSSNNYLSKDTGSAPDFNSAVILLHPIYNGTNITHYECKGNISVRRGSSSASLRDTSIIIETATAFNENHYFSEIQGGNTNAYSLVTCDYLGVKYVAVRFNAAVDASARNFGFDGYIQGDANALLVVNYFNTNTSTVLNAEVNGSIASITYNLTKIINSSTTIINSSTTVVPSGNVGIGTSSPIYKLDIQGNDFTTDAFNGIGIGDITADRLLIGYKTGALTTGLVPAQINVDSSVIRLASRDISSGAIAFHTGAGITEKMRILADGKVGIGTASPLGRFDVKGLANLVNLRGASVGDTIYMTFYNSADARRGYIGYGNTSSNLFSIQNEESGGHINLGTAGAGNVGVNIGTPLEKLHVSGNALIGENTTASTVLAVNGTAATVKSFNLRSVGLNRWGLRLDNTAESAGNLGSDFRLSSYNDGGSFLSDVLFAKRSTGNVGIGTTNLIGRLTVNVGLTAFTNDLGSMSFGTVSLGNDSITSSCAPVITGKSNDSVGLTLMAGTADANPSYDMRFNVRRNDNVDFSSSEFTRPAFTFTRYNTTLLTILRNGNSTFTGTVTATGGFFNSDARLKDIISRDGDMVTFKWKDGRDNKTHIGYIAQEVQEIIPDAIEVGADGMMSVNYIEVLITKIAQLEKRIVELESKLK